MKKMVLIAREIIVLDGDTLLCDFLCDGFRDGMGYCRIFRTTKGKARVLGMIRDVGVSFYSRCRECLDATATAENVR